MYENTEDLDRLKTSSLVLTVIFSQGEHNLFNVMFANFQLSPHPSDPTLSTLQCCRPAESSAAELKIGQDFRKMGCKRVEFLYNFVVFTFPMCSIEKMEFGQMWF
jgi:hypothetical protein